jgi:putative CRISPR-associated protein (TIGR02619 family)
MTHWDDTLPTFENELMDKIASIEYEDNPTARRRLSAELNTLDRIDLESGDRVVLISTDSAPGRVCSEALAGIIEEVYPVEVEIVRIEGMQVYDAKRLRELGLKNLVREVLDRYLANDDVRYSYEILINPTGGYKAVVPFLTILGMLYGRKAIYLFEHAEELVELPPLPLTFDIHIFERVKDALRYIDEEVAVHPTEYFSRIVGYDPLERDLFLSFTEPFEDGKITLSPLAYVLLKIEESAEPCMVSDRVLETLGSLRGEKRKIVERMISSSANPLWRDQKIHRWSNNGKILIIKPGNTAERLAGFMKNGRFYVALAFDSHDRYEKELGNYTLDELQSFDYREWESTQESDTIALGPDEEKRRLIEENEALRRELEKLEPAGQRADRVDEEELRSCREENEALRADREEALLAKESCETELEELRKRDADSREMVRNLRQEHHDRLSKLSKVEAEYARCTAEIDGCRRELERMENELRDERERSDSFRMEYKELSERVQALKKACKRLEREKEEKCRERKEQDTEMMRLRRKLEREKERYSQMQESVASAQKRAKKWKLRAKKGKKLANELLKSLEESEDELQRCRKKLEALSLKYRKEKGRRKKLEKKSCDAVKRKSGKSIEVKKKKSGKESKKKRK